MSNSTKALTILILVCGWGLFLFMYSAVLNRVREFPGWSQFLVFELPWDNFDQEAATPASASGVLHAASVVTEASAQSANAAPPSTTRSQPTVSSGVAALGSTASPALRPTLTPTPAYPTRCAGSIETRFAPGVAGYTHLQREIQLRPTPGDSAGIDLAPGTRFVTTGAPVCADLYGYPSNDHLWWPVRLTSGSASGQTGWLVESVISESQVFIHLFPE
jgi:hypothetical protein